MGKLQIWERPTVLASLIVGWLFWGAVTGTRGEPPSPAAAGAASRSEAAAQPRPDRPPAATRSGEFAIRPSPPTLLDPNVRPIDLGTALRLANVQNPQLMIARQRVVEAEALRQLAAAQFLPSINLGMNYDSHTGPLQQSNGNILSVNRSALYVGAGAGAVAAGTVEVPGVVLQGNVAEGVFGFLISRQVVAQRQFATVAQRNQTFLAATLAYSELLRAEGHRAIALQVRDEARRVAELTGAYAAAGQGRQADAHRARTELDQREADVQAAEGEVLTASARLCYVLNLDPSLRLHPTDAWVVPNPIVPGPMPLSEEIAVALLRRPELGERRAVIREAFLALEGSRVLPFSPTVLVGFSGGGFGGGSNLVRPVFGGFGGRSDFDVAAYWTIQNLGVGNASLINLAKARLGTTRLQEIAVLDLVRAEVAEAFAKTHARYAQIGTTEEAVRSSTRGFREDLIRIENTIAPALEVVDSLRLLARSRYAYLDSIVDYNRAQFELYVAMGQPPADVLAHTVPTEGVAPRDLPPTLSPDRMLTPGRRAAPASGAPAAP
jgi:outer membrane protein TolC